MRFILAVFSVIFGISLIKQVIDYECRGNTPKLLEGRDINPRAMFVAEVLAVVTAIIVPAAAIIGFIKHR